MKILTANIAMGLRDMDYLLNNLRGLAAYHGWGAYFAALVPLTRGKWAGPPYWPNRVSYMHKHKNLEPSFKLIKEVDADVVILNEILPEIHEPMFSLKLKQLGYKSIAIGFGAKYPDARVSTIVAAKKAGEQFDLARPQTPHPGCGGGGGGPGLDGKRIIGG